MPADPTSGPEAPPADELASAEATLRVLQQAVHGIATDDLAKPTPCREFDVAALTDHLLNSITSIGSVAARFPFRQEQGQIEYGVGQRFTSGLVRRYTVGLTLMDRRYGITTTEPGVPISFTAAGLVALIAGAVLGAFGLRTEAARASPAAT